jgi:gliding motility-associated lipoprotein GldB
MAIKIRIVRNYQKISRMKPFLSILFLSLVLFSCTRNPLKVNVSNVSIDLKIKHLDVDLFKLQEGQVEAAIPKLKDSHGDFFDIFTYRMINIGGVGQPEFPELLNSFVSDTLIRSLEKKVAEKIDTVKIRGELEKAFRHYRYYFPEKEIPVVYTCISGFNQSVVTADGLIGISLDKFLGTDSPFYQQLGLPIYKRRNMRPEKIVPDVMYAWGVTEWPKSDQTNSVLGHIVHEGKMMYFMDAMLPELHDTLKMGYTKKQLDFCKKAEASMWTFLAEHKLLFSTDRMVVKRFVDDGPYTSSFTDQSPGRTGIWLGWQIVRSYMKKNPEVKLADLMKNADFQAILNQSGYQP